MSMGSLQDLRLPSNELPLRSGTSPSVSSISSSSDDAPQLSFEYIWDEAGNPIRISKRPQLVDDSDTDQNVLGAIEDSSTGQNHSQLNNEVLANERTSENPQSIASILSRSHSVSASHDFLSAPPPSRPFTRVASNPVVPPSGRSSLLTASDRPLGRARRVPIETKRKEEVENIRRDREDDDRDREARWQRIRDQEKENWVASENFLKANDPPLSSSLIRTQSDPFPVADQPEPLVQPHPIENVPSRMRRPISKQQRVLGAISRIAGKESLPRTSGGSSELRSVSNSLESSPLEENRPRVAAGGARRITKEERERQEREAAEMQATLERQQQEQERMEIEERERELQRIAEVEEEERAAEAEEQRRNEEAARQREKEVAFEQERERYARPQSRQAEAEDGRQRERMARFSHQRRDSETVMPESTPLPPRMSPSARHVPLRDPQFGTASQSQSSHPEYPPGLARSGSTAHQTVVSNPPVRAQHRRSPTAPEAHHSHGNSNGVNGHVNGKSKTWAMGAEMVGDVDKDLGGLGQLGEGSVREKEVVREARPSAVQPVQVTGAKNFTVNGRTYGKLDMIGKGGSSRVYRVITPSNEIFALKRVSLDRTDQETMQGYMNEIALLRRLDGNDRIIRLVESEVRGGSKGHLMLVMECGEVDLARLIAARQSAPLDLVWVSYYWKQMLEAVHVIHEEKIVHSDLKPANFVLVKGELKLIDFGIANAIANDTTNIQRDHQIGTVNYMSPESIEVVEGNSRLKVGRPSDVWSLGCILYQMIYGTPPFHSLSVLQKMRVIPDPNNVIDFPTETVPIVPQPRNTAAPPGGGSTPPKKLYHLKKPVPMEVIETLKSCLAKNPKERETIPELLAAGWLHPKGRSEELNLAEDEVIIDKCLLRQLVDWAMTVGQSTGKLQGAEFEETLENTLVQLQSAQRKR